MEENQLWALFWKFAAAVAAVLIITVGGCTVHRDAKITSMVEHGANPLDASCAVGRDNSSVCAIRAARLSN